MLTKADFGYNFFILKTMMASRILPLDFEGKNKTLKVPKSPWKLRISLGLFGVTIIHSLYIFFKLLQVLTFSEKIAKHQLVFHVDVCLAMFMLEGWYLSCFVIDPETFVALFNDIFTTSDGYNDQKGSRPKARSRQEWFSLALPTLIVLIHAFAILLITYDHSLAFLLYSSLSENYKTPFWFRLLFVEEIHLLAFVASNAILVLTTQILFFEKVTGSLKMLNKSSRPMWTEDVAEEAYEELRKIQLKVNLFNNINRYIAFSFKLFSIILCTLNGYFMIVYFSADPMFGCLYYGVFGALCMMYSIIYERAFAIPGMVRLTKSMILLTAGAGLRSPGFKCKMNMRLRSVPEVGIQVGQFHTFERVATPVFVDYVLRNVMGLLAMHLNN